ncbi:MAG: hypothetical protein ACTXOO_05870 [Sodalis sp. (in: enterobacteria)]
MKIQEKINTYLELLSKSKRNIVASILPSSHTDIASSIAICARTAIVSELTVNHFCHYLESTHHPDLSCISFGAWRTGGRM